MLYSAFLVLLVGTFLVGWLGFYFVGVGFVCCGCFGWVFGVDWLGWFFVWFWGFCFVEAIR